MPTDDFWFQQMLRSTRASGVPLYVRDPVTLLNIRWLLLAVQLKEAWGDDFYNPKLTVPIFRDTEIVRFTDRFGVTFLAKDKKRRGLARGSR